MNLYKQKEIVYNISLVSLCAHLILQKLFQNPTIRFLEKKKPSCIAVDFRVGGKGDFFYFLTALNFLLAPVFLTTFYFIA